MIDLIVLLIAGIGAGIITGLFSASAVMFAAPVLILFLDFNPYLAIGLSLAIDFFASFTSMLVYKKNRNVEFRNISPFLISALVAVILGSYFSVFVPSNNLALFEGLAIFLIGIGIFKRKGREIKSFNLSNSKKFVFLIILGFVVGLIAGVFGAGGGLMIFLTLVFILNYPTHKAIGTSVLIMIFIALTGAVTHYIYEPFTFNMLLFGGVGGVLGAKFSSDIANKLNEITLNKIIGIILSGLGLSLFIKELI